MCVRMCARACGGEGVRGAREGHGVCVCVGGLTLKIRSKDREVRTGPSLHPPLIRRLYSI
jgi:hypothetical protein